MGDKIDKITKNSMFRPDCSLLKRLGQVESEKGGGTSRPSTSRRGDHWDGGGIGGAGEDQMNFRQLPEEGKDQLILNQCLSILK